ncbi:WW domain-containing protein [Sarocladium implicatum]|nr:WW domain-containing protein [Sarocladium implicatum]
MQKISAYTLEPNVKFRKAKDAREPRSYSWNMVASPAKEEAAEESKPSSPPSAPAHDDAEVKSSAEDRAEAEEATNKSDTDSEGEVKEADDDTKNPPLPNEPTPSGPPLPNEPAPAQEDDGWDCQFDPNSQSWFFYNRFTGKTQWENPRVPTAETAVPAAPGTEASAPLPPAHEKPAAGGYNPAIHGDYDPTAWYAQGDGAGPSDDSTVVDPYASAALADPYAAAVGFNRFTGQFQAGDMGPDRHSDEAKSRRQMNAFFDVDAAANSHDGRSLKAERSNKKPSKNELKAFKEKRRARKEEKRRAWLRD